MSTGVSPDKSKNYAGSATLILLGHWLSAVGSRFFAAASVWLLTTALGVTATSWLVAGFQFAPTILALPISMAVIDAVGRRKIVTICDVARTGSCFLGAAAVGFGLSPVFAICACIVVIRVFDTFYTPTIMAGVGAAARSTRFSPQFILLIVNSTASLLAPLLVPIAATTSTSIALAVNGVSYLCSLIAFRVGGMTLDDRSDYEGILPSLKRWRSSLTEGFAEFRKTPTLTKVVPTLPVIDLAYAGVSVTLPALAISFSSEHGALFYTIFVFAYAGSRILGASIGRKFVNGRFDGTLLAINAFVQGLLYILLATVSSFPLAAICLFVIGAFSGSASLSVNEIIQSCTARDKRARVFSMVSFVVVLFVPLGPVVAALSAGSGVQNAAFILGVLLIVVGLRPLFSRSIWRFSVPESSQ